MARGAVWQGVGWLCGAVLVLAADAATAQEKQTGSVQFSLASVSAPPGALVRVPVFLLNTSAQPTAVLAAIDYDNFLLEPRGIITGPLINSTGKQVEYFAEGGRLRVLVSGAWNSIPSGSLMALVFAVNAEAATGQTAQLMDAGSSASNSVAEPIPATVSASQVEVLANSGHHSADRTANWKIELSELLRVIQFYNVGGLRCAEGTEDGYAPGAGAQQCMPHSSDYLEFDWRVSLGELLRLIQFFNTSSGMYHVDSGGEDGYSPGPFKS